MTGNDDKMLLIGSAISRQVEQERKDIINRANETRERELNAYKEQVIDEMFHQIQQKTRAVRQKAIRDKAQAEQKAHQELLTRREELSARVFSAVKGRLHEYAASEAYRTALLAQLAALKDKWDHSHSAVLLGEADKALETRVKAALPGCAVEYTRAIRLGGFRLRNREAGILVDQTLDSKLEDQRSWYLANCGLKTV